MHRHSKARREPLAPPFLAHGRQNPLGSFCWHGTGSARRNTRPLQRRIGSSASARHALCFACFRLTLADDGARAAAFLPALLGLALRGSMAGGVGVPGSRGGLAGALRLLQMPRRREAAHLVVVYDGDAQLRVLPAVLAGASGGSSMGGHACLSGRRAARGLRGASGRLARRACRARPPRNCCSAACGNRPESFRGRASSPAEGAADAHPSPGCGLPWRRPSRFGTRGTRRSRLASSRCARRRCPSQRVVDCAALSGPALAASQGTAATGADGRETTIAEGASLLAGSVPLARGGRCGRAFLQTQSLACALAD